MKLQEKHIKFLDALPLDEWVCEYRLPIPQRSGITRTTVKAFGEMGIVDIVKVDDITKITDEDIGRGYVKTRAFGYFDLVAEKQRPGTLFVKKTVSDYRTRNYEIEALKVKITALNEKIAELEREDSPGGK